MSDPHRTQMLTDPNRTVMGAPPNADPNKTIMGSAPTLNATQTIKPVQCPVCKTFNPVGVMFCVECGLIFDRALPGDAFGAPTVILPCLVDEAGREHVLRPGPNVIGRQGDVLIEDGRVSRRHAQVVSEGDGLFVEDLGSTNGTSLNETPLPTGQRQPIQSGDKVSIGGYILVVSLPGESAKTAMGLSGRTAAIAVPPTAETAAAWLEGSDLKIRLHEGVNTFGRKAENDAQVVDPYVSGRHGTIEVTAEGIFLTDTGSTNGTLLNDARLEPNRRTQIGPDDVIKLGGLELRVRSARENA